MEDAPDLFGSPAPASPAPLPPQPLSVSELTRAVRDLIEGGLGSVWVQGEICNYRKQSSGHHYFGLKDERSLLSCVMFSSKARFLRAELADGMMVQVRGEMTVYEARGQYQLNVQLVQPAGAGLLQARFEALKRKLEAEGLFDQARKQLLPAFPECIGIVTSPTGAAIGDMLNILQRRAPWARIVIYPARVQGEGAAQEIAAGVRAFNTRPELAGMDVLVVARGGGSAEDLWAFNEEAVARAIADSVLPVVSAVGHEIDFTISDFVADLRAPTPSAAAELIVPDKADLLKHLRRAGSQMSRELTGCLVRWRSHLGGIARSALMREPQRRLAELAQRIDEHRSYLPQAATAVVTARKNQLAALQARLAQHRPDQVLSIRRQELRLKEVVLSQAISRRLQKLRHAQEQVAGKLALLSPEGTLARGYSITTDESGRPMVDASELAKGDSLITRFKKGKARSIVDRTDLSGEA